MRKRSRDDEKVNIETFFFSCSWFKSSVTKVWCLFW